MLGDCGLLCVSSRMEEMSRLTSLSLVHCRLSGEATDALAQSVSRLHLKELEGGGCTT